MAAEAQAKLDVLQSLMDPLVGLARIHGLMGDLSGHDLDGLVPEPVGAKMRSLAYGWWERSKQEGWSIRQMYGEYAIDEGFRAIGTPAHTADVVEEWMDAGAADGFNITPTHLPGGIDDFVELMVPELQRRGRFRMAYDGATLRENLGLALGAEPLEAGRSGDGVARSLTWALTWDACTAPRLA